MSKKSYMTHITPLPASISRETAVKHLHDHEEMIKLNPLVLRHTRTSPPPNATPDEAQGMIWYEITDEIQYLPGTPLKGEVSYKAGFYDLAVGLQTHTFAPAGVDIQGKWVVGGNAPGEPKEPMELGVEKPRDGLYIREDVELKCNVLMSNFVKRNLKKSHGVLVESLIKKAGSNDTQSKQERPDYTRAPSSGTPWTDRDSNTLASPAPSNRSIPTSNNSQDAHHWRPASSEKRPPFSSAPGIYSEVRANKSRPPQHDSDYPQQSSPTSYEHNRSTSTDKSLPLAATKSNDANPNMRYAQHPGDRAVDRSPNVNVRPPRNLATELDGNPVAAQAYYMYQGQKAAELE